MSLELDILKLVCQKLDQANIPYMLTGSFAANFYAVPRMTRDIDIVIAIQNSKIDRLFATFHQDFYIDKESIKEAIKHQGMFNIIHNDSVFKIDFVVLKDTAYRSTEFLRKRQVQMDNVQIWIVAPEDLIISKLDWAKDSLSKMQLDDIRNLFLAVNDLDKDYIDMWVRKLELSHIYEKVQKDA